MISLILLGLTYGLGSNNCASLGVIICTIAGAILPIFGLLIPLSGLTLSFAGLLSVPWLASCTSLQLLTGDRKQVKQGNISNYSHLLILINN